MDKSKLGAIAVLLALGGGLFLSKANDPAAAPGDPDAAQEAAAGDSHDHGAPKTKKVPPLPKIDLTGLIIQDSRPGKGAGAVEGDALTMNYKGALTNGEVFDQSYGRGPFDFTLGTGQVIKGWDYGIKGMKAGGKRKLTIPARLGYEDRGSPPKIPGGATLVFEVELLKISKSAS